MDTCQFEATLYFKERPAWTRDALVASWELEGYTCEDSDKSRAESDEVVFTGFRGGCYVILYEAVNKSDAEPPESYPEVACIDLDYDSTYLINHREGLQCFQEAGYVADIVFRVVADPDEPKAAHNEWVATLLGIHQVSPIHALQLHDLGILVGSTDLDENLNYGNSHLEAPPQFMPSMAFGTLFSEADGIRRGWTTGLAHFQHPNILVESPTHSFMDISRVLFNSGYMVTAQRVFKAGESGEVADLFFRIHDCRLNDQPALRFQIEP